MRTLKIANGDLVFDANTGVASYVEGYEKGVQDVARALLIEYDPFFYEGNELINIQGKKAISLNQSLVNQYLYAAINRLILKQQNFTDDKVLQINNITSKVVGLSSIVFYVDVLMASGTSAKIVRGLNLKTAELYQVDPTESLVVI